MVVSEGRETEVRRWRSSTREEVYRTQRGRSQVQGERGHRPERQWSELKRWRLGAREVEVRSQRGRGQRPERQKSEAREADVRSQRGSGHISWRRHERKALDVGCLPYHCLTITLIKRPLP